MQVVLVVRGDVGCEGVPENNGAGLCFEPRAFFCAQPQHAFGVDIALRAEWGTAGQ
jgi:hypothetical protein